MAEHRIRLRGAWDWRIQTDEEEFVRPVNLPAHWPIGFDRPFRLVRKFGRPPIDPGSGRVRLELVDVPGLLSVHLNDREVGQADGDRLDWVVELTEPLLARNELVLEVDLRSTNRAEAANEWGAIALVIASRVELVD